MAKQTNVQTSLLGRRVFLKEENTQAAQRYFDANVSGGRGAGSPLPWLSLHPYGGEAVAVFTDRDGELNVTVSTTDGLVTLTASWLTLRAPDPLLEAVQAVVDYNWSAEEEDYADCSDDVDDNNRKNHIFTHLQYLQQWLDKTSRTTRGE